MNSFKAGISLILYLLVIIIANNIGEIYPKFSTLTGTISYIAVLGMVINYTILIIISIIGPKKSREQPEKEPSLREIKDKISRHLEPVKAKNIFLGIIGGIIISIIVGGGLTLYVINPKLLIDISLRLFAGLAIISIPYITNPNLRETNTIIRWFKKEFGRSKNQ